MYSYYPYMSTYQNYHSFLEQAAPFWGDSFYRFTEEDVNWYRQRPIRGQATWTDGGRITKCGIPWSKNRYLTAAVGANSPYRCGQSLKIRNLSVPGGREIIVTVVDQVAGYPANRISLHRRAFEALGAHPSLGVMNIEIIPSPELEQERWGKYLLEVTQTAYPGYNIIDYRFVGKQQQSPQQIRETYEFILQAPREKIRVRGNVVYNPSTNRVISFNLVET
ncbi:DUF3889 domain-containing protein [Bacillus sp. DNRA2]|uniref:DUF3889 domain-containing protein n=1 Tax=Bacillus sp. DNRA2 TaxID=2723053 RepID=UPI002006E672|nr:DUF3889 domain-containing protein [Bacillus sp. DNRA2]